MAAQSIPPILTRRLRLESMSAEFLAAFLDGQVERAQALVDYRVPNDFSLSTKLPAVRRRLDLISADPSQHPWMYRAIVSQATGDLVGQISFHHKAPDPDLARHGETGAELGYVIEPAFRRRGFATESAIGMMHWAEREFGVRRFVLTISPTNLPSLRAAQSMGFKIIGEQQDPVDGPEFVMAADVHELADQHQRSGTGRDR